MSSDAVFNACYQQYRQNKSLGDASNKKGVALQVPLQDVLDFFCGCIKRCNDLSSTSGNKSSVASPDKQAIIRQLIRKGGLAPGYKEDQLVGIDLFVKLMDIIEASNLVTNDTTIHKLCTFDRFSLIFDKLGTTEGSGSSAARFIAKDGIRSVFEAISSSGSVSGQMNQLPSKTFGEAVSKIQSARPTPPPFPAQRSNPSLITLMEMITLFYSIAQQLKAILSRGSTGRIIDALDMAVAYKSGAIERVKNMFLEQDAASTSRPQTPTPRRKHVTEDASPGSPSTKAQQPEETEAESPASPDKKKPSRVKEWGNWIEMHDPKTGRNYFRHKETKEAVWKTPAEVLSMQNESKSPTLPPASPRSEPQSPLSSPRTTTAPPPTNENTGVTVSQASKPEQLKADFELKETQLKEAISALAKQREENRRLEKELTSQKELSERQATDIDRLTQSLASTTSKFEKLTRTSSIAVQNDRLVTELRGKLAASEQKLEDTTGDCAFFKKQAEQKTKKFQELSDELEDVRAALVQAHQMNLEKQDEVKAAKTKYEVQQSTDLWFEQLRKVYMNMFREEHKYRVSMEESTMKQLQQDIRRETERLACETEELHKLRDELRLQAAVLTRKQSDLLTREAELQQQRVKFNEEVALAEGTTLEERVRRMALLQKVERELVEREKMIIAAEATIVRGKAAKKRIQELEGELSGVKKELKDARGCVALSIDSMKAPTWSEIEGDL